MSPGESKTKHKLSSKKGTSLEPKNVDSNSIKTKSNTKEAQQNNRHFHFVRQSDFQNITNNNDQMVTNFNTQSKHFQLSDSIVSPNFYQYWCSISNMKLNQINTISKKDKNIICNDFTKLMDLSYFVTMDNNRIILFKNIKRTNKIEQIRWVVLDLYPTMIPFSPQFVRYDYLASGILFLEELLTDWSMGNDIDMNSILIDKIKKHKEYDNTLYSANSLLSSWILLSMTALCSVSTISLSLTKAVSLVLAYVFALGASDVDKGGLGMIFILASLVGEGCNA